MVRSFFKPTDSLAKSYPCPSPGGADCPRRIVQHEHDRFAAFCGQSPPECDTLLLTRKDVIIHKFDVVEFSSHIAKAFAFAVKPARRHTTFSFLWRIGTYIPVAGRRFPVFLLLAYEKSLFLQALNHLLVSERSSFILLGPTDDFMDQTYEDLLTDKSCVFIPMADTLIWDGHAFTTSRPAQEMLADFRSDALPDGFVEAGHVARLYSEGRMRGVTESEISEILGSAKNDFDLIVDARSNKIWHPRIDPEAAAKKFRVSYHASILLRLVEARAPLTPDQFVVLSRLESDDEEKTAKAKTEQVQRTRIAVEPNTKRGEYGFIKRVMVEGDISAYQWAPDPGLRYALIYPLESDE